MSIKRGKISETRKNRVTVEKRENKRRGKTGQNSKIWRKVFSLQITLFNI
jgi:hypothetical protein